ncbi:MAG: sodium/proline symporter [Gammaproteobacteria bacterium]
MMSKSQAILFTLIAYMSVLVLIGVWASRRTRDNTDFFLGGRRLGPLVAAISASASSSSAWTLLSVSGMAYLWGLPALWLFPATLMGFLINWLYVAPRLKRASRENGAITLTEFLADSIDPAGRKAVMRLGAGIVLFAFVFYVAAQFQAAGAAFASSFDLPMATAISIGAGVVLAYTMLGGFWAVSVTDTIQGLLMALTALLLPLVALAHVGGLEPLIQGLRIAPQAGAVASTGIAGIGFVLGTLGIGLGYPGQPHVVNRFMALRDDRALAQARVIAILWAVLIYGGMLLLGLCGRVLYTGLVDPEHILFEMATRLISPVAAGVMIAAVLSAIMSTADSQLLVAASAVTNDLGDPTTGHQAALMHSRVVVVAISVLAVVMALAVPDQIFTRVLFAWHAIGSAFGPPLVLSLAGVRLSARGLFWAMATGFGLTALLHWLPYEAGPGDALERLLPLSASLLVAWVTRIRGSAAHH